ncbi:hypothetical protein EVAR_4341_1 [Eumeta japonica]|uniref:Uncharacterized protein n=1 Tax=Eumeta variegata TaxID=151549 RepID=A0A4C1VBN3_EUMVA|nr:hypothetical protein EVAR_4341_1 [Eumeta japonica]
MYNLNGLYMWPGTPVTSTYRLDNPERYRSTMLEIGPRNKIARTFSRSGTGPLLLPGKQYNCSFHSQDGTPHRVRLFHPGQSSQTRITLAWDRGLLPSPWRRAVWGGVCRGIMWVVPVSVIRNMHCA